MLAQTLDSYQRDAETVARIEGHGRSGVLVYVDGEPRDLLSFPTRGSTHLPAVLFAHEYLGASGEQNVQGVGLVTFVDDHRILGIRACGAARRELAQRLLVETG